MPDSSSTPHPVGTIAIDLVPFFQANYTVSNKTGYRLYILAQNAVGMPDEIFRYYQHPLGHTDVDPLAELSGVCTWPDLEAYPANLPRDTDSPRVFRLSYIDIIVNDAATAQEVWSAVQKQVRDLVAVIRDGQELTAGEMVSIS